MEGSEALIGEWDGKEHFINLRLQASIKESRLPGKRVSQVQEGLSVESLHVCYSWQFSVLPTGSELYPCVLGSWKAFDLGRWECSE